MAPDSSPQARARRAAAAAAAVFVARRALADQAEERAFGDQRETREEPPVPAVTGSEQAAPISPWGARTLGSGRGKG